ncbi:uncharacterized protein L3040_006647 [Drepanopeziza brunnea f. sp. 'multigermtubi']|uniref:uncharacterized protein n=1 Tax=Drepanopeziza brunnea f. sp. 'multigermtubi' TaxID=698441 RepID=UPI00239329A0|nr:hypothetical protein L3040_006647 [Drepanopeziza brunnea f. sp. 'multigermtubi']
MCMYSASQYMRCRPYPAGANTTCSNSVITRRCPAKLQHGVCEKIVARESPQGHGPTGVRSAIETAGVADPWAAVPFGSSAKRALGEREKDEDDLAQACREKHLSNENDDGDGDGDDDREMGSAGAGGGARSGPKRRGRGRGVTKGLGATGAGQSSRRSGPRRYPPVAPKPARWGRLGYGSCEGGFAGRLFMRADQKYGGQLSYGGDFAGQLFMHAGHYYEVQQSYGGYSPGPHYMDGGQNYEVRQSCGGDFSGQQSMHAGQNHGVQQSYGGGIPGPQSEMDVDQRSEGAEIAEGGSGEEDGAVTMVGEEPTEGLRSYPKKIKWKVQGAALMGIKMAAQDQIEGEGGQAGGGLEKGVSKKRVATRVFEKGMVERGVVKRGAVNKGVVKKEEVEKGVVKKRVVKKTLKASQ